MSRDSWLSVTCDISQLRLVTHCIVDNISRACVCARLGAQALEAPEPQADASAANGENGAMTEAMEAAAEPDAATRRAREVLALVSAPPVYSLESC